MSLDTKYHFLSTPMKKTEFIRVKCNHIPEDISKRHGLASKVNNHEWACIKTYKEIPRTKKAAFLA